MDTPMHAGGRLTSTRAGSLAPTLILGILRLRLLVLHSRHVLLVRHVFLLGFAGILGKAFREPHRIVCGDQTHFAQASFQVQ